METMHSETDHPTEFNQIYEQSFQSIIGAALDRALGRLRPALASCPHLTAYTTATPQRDTLFRICWPHRSLRHVLMSRMKFPHPALPAPRRALIASSNC